MQRSLHRAVSIFSKHRNIASAKHGTRQQDKLFLRGKRNNSSQEGNYVSPLTASSQGDYVTTLSLGTPPQTFTTVFVDTGSTLIWLKCSSNKGDRTQLVFKANRSATFKNLTCSNPICQHVQQDTGIQACHNATDSSACTFEYLYADMSGAAGIMASDVLNLQNKVQTIHNKKRSTNNMTFGCALKARGIQGDGVIGLDRGPYSLVSQLGPLIGYRFSYCLVPVTLNASSSIILGHSAKIFGKKVRHTPLLSPNNTRRSAYYIDVRKISLGETRVPIPSKAFRIKDGSGGTVLDTGTTFVLLATPIYRAVMATLSVTVPYPKVFFRSFLEGVPCFDRSSSKSVDPELPSMVFHLRGGAKLDIPWQNLFFLVEVNVICMSVQESPAGVADLSIIGNRAQQNFHFSFDLKRNRLRFARRNCTEFL
ncbi:hypothetical protein KI387_025766 [Taxus chinensis]|uniref:Peptidase A1 domain-containing protein n=1 Tax=Taxus chinensis TaxID=29808 RepID=A0AA38KZC7_TAXCH|nr:hypothetical protein KI387_025766 [Taxus chinensis]